MFTFLFYYFNDHQDAMPPRVFTFEGDSKQQALSQLHKATGGPAYIEVVYVGRNQTPAEARKEYENGLSR